MTKTGTTRVLPPNVAITDLGTIPDRRGSAGVWFSSSFVSVVFGRVHAVLSLPNRGLRDLNRGRESSSRTAGESLFPNLMA